MRAPLFLLVDAVAPSRQRSDRQEPPPPPERPKRGSPRVRRALIAALFALVAAPIAVANADWKKPSGFASAAASYAPGRMIVKLRPGVAPAARTSALRAHGARLDRRLTPQGALLVSVPGGRSVLDAVAEMKRDPRVEYAEPDWRGHAEALPNDPLFGRQWGLQTAPAAWDRTTGSPGVKVAVIDSGVTFGHPELAPNLWTNPGESGGGKENNGIDDDHNGFVDDSRGWDFVQGDNDPTDNFGHGTATTGVIAARGNNAIGMAGVAWQASVIPVRALDNQGYGYCSEWAAGIAYAVQAGARVVNMSFGGDEACRSVKDAVDAAPNVLFVASAGNDGLPAADFPCAFASPNIVCVAATDSSDALADFSNYNGQSVDLAAPGKGILVPWPKFDDAGETIFADDFESGLGHWLPGGSPNTWGLTTAAPHAGSFALTDSPVGNYASDTDNNVTLMQELDLRNKRDCFAGVWLKSHLNPGPSNWAGSNDSIQAESSDGLVWGARPDGWTGSWDYYKLWTVDLSQLEGRDTAGAFRFRLQTDGSANFDGVYLDDFKVRCFAPVATYSGAPDEFISDDGTSYSAPLVSGAAVLMLSLDPQLSAAELKQKLMSSVDPLPALAGKTVSGGRLNIAKAVASVPLAPSSGQAAPAASGLAADLASLVKKLRTRVLLRGFTAARLHAPAAGRLTLVVKGGKQTLATGARSVKRAGVYSLRVRPTRRGRSLLRHSKRLHNVTVVLTFKPRSGSAQVQSTKLALRR